MQEIGGVILDDKKQEIRGVILDDKFFASYGCLN